jgi:hypothetical protein
MSKTVTTIDDPRIAKIKEIRARNPGVSRHQIYLALGVGVATLDKWAARGWIERFPKLKQNANSPWKGTGAATPPRRV